MKQYARIMLAAGASGSGKTLVTCGILQALSARGLRVASFKCGPDYIDPMFHARVIGTKSCNLDTFFTDGDTTRYLFARSAAEADVSVIEGVMGYYDGLGGKSVLASSYDVARVTDTPVVLIVNCRGMSLTALAYVKGILEYRKDSRIQGVILNRISEKMYTDLKRLLEEEIGVKVYGYVPETQELKLESRHLGLLLPDEVAGLRENLKNLARLLERTLDLDGLLALARTAGALPCRRPELPVIRKETGAPVRIAVARDEAFCFLYGENLQLLGEMGAELIFFSPLHDRELPKTDGLLLYGGYPELHAVQLCGNHSMRESIRAALTAGMPCMAECGGFMYLQEEMEDVDGNAYAMVGALPGRSHYTKKLNRFGYITLKPLQEQMLGTDIGEIRAHEFHYYDSSSPGAAFRAEKPLRAMEWDCIQGSETCIAGFPHLYYYSNPKVAARFLEKCARYGEGLDAAAGSR